MMSSLKLFLILYYIKQIDSKLPCVCSVVDRSDYVDYSTRILISLL